MNKSLTLLPVLATLSIAGLAAEKTATSQSRQCALHHQALKTDWVKIQYGLVYLTDGYRQAQLKKFPNSNKVAYGGCEINVAKDAKTGRMVWHSPQFEKVNYCAKCRSAEFLWYKAHPHG